MEIVYIIHDTQAKIVDHEIFYRISEGGGTNISSAYALCEQVIRQKYPPNEWNIYPFHFSDGDNWSSEDDTLCVKLLKEYLGKRVSLETMVILDGIFDYSSKWDKKMSDDIMWPDVKKLIENYKKFLTYPHDSCKMVVINLTTME